MKVPCKLCGALILPTTADRNEGLCIPCRSGTRESINAAKQRRAEEQKPSAVYFRETWLHLCSKKATHGFAALTHEEQTFVAMHNLLATVLRGGFHTYFDLVARDEIETAKRAFIEIGASEISELVQRAQSILFPDGIPADFVQQQEQLPTWTEEEIESDTDPEWSVALENVNGEFYEIANAACDRSAAYFDTHFTSGENINVPKTDP